MAPGLGHEPQTRAWAGATRLREGRTSGRVGLRMLRKEASAISAPRRPGERPGRQRDPFCLEPRHCPHCLPCRFENHQQVSPLEQAESHHPKIREPQEEEQLLGSQPGAQTCSSPPMNSWRSQSGGLGWTWASVFLTTVLGLSHASSKGKLDSLEK